MLVVGPNKDLVQELKAQLTREFDMKDFGPTTKILGIQIHYDRKDWKICLFEKNYLSKVLQRFNVHDSKPISTSVLSILNYLKYES